MFDFAWSEIALIAGVALILIGPKDMPVALRAVTGMIKKARRMAGEFQTHVDEMMREANLDEVRSSFNEIRNFDLRSQVEKTVDPDGSLRNSIDKAGETSFEPTPTQVVEPLPEVIVPEAPLAHSGEADAGEGPPDELVAAEDNGAPAFIPPNLVPKSTPQPRASATPQAPAFIPPAVVLQHRSPPPS